ncbi:MAG: Gfo/Idh/MocA family protein [Thermoprotei archaeon]
MSIKFGIISMAHVHADGYAKELSSKKALQGIYDEDEKRGSSAASKFQVKLYGDVEALLDDVDAVLIASPTALHSRYVRLASSRSRHILVEKPLAFSSSDAREMIDAASSVKFGICFGSRLSPVNQKVKEILSEKRIGRVNFARIRVAHSAALDRWFSQDNWFVRKELSGGGGLLDLGIHGVDLLYWLKGEPPSYAVGLTSNSTKAYGIDDQGIVAMAWEDGAIGEVEGAWTQRGGLNSLEIYGTEGTIVTNLPSRPISLFQSGHWSEITVDQNQKTVIDDFIEAIEKNREPIAPGRDGLISTAVMEAAYSTSPKELGLKRSRSYWEA